MQKNSSGIPAQTDQNDPLDEGWGPLSGLPGNPMMWLLIWSELLVFGAAFIGFAVARVLDPQSFMRSQDTLDRLAGGLNTMVLLTSGFCAALAVEAQQHDKGKPARLWIVAAIALGLVFLLIKGREYADKLAHGIGIETNSFFTLYYLTTGFHALHVVFGIVILALVGWKNSVENIETGTAFWHMVDLIWVILFPLIYLMR